MNEGTMAQKKEFTTLKKRVIAVEKKFAALARERTKLEHALDKWARKYNIPSRAHTVPHSRRYRQACKPEMMHPNGPYYCLLDTRRSTPTKCVYRCYRI